VVTYLLKGSILNDTWPSRPILLSQYYSYYIMLYELVSCCGFLNVNVPLTMMRSQANLCILCHWWWIWYISNALVDTSCERWWVEILVSFFLLFITAQINVHIIVMPRNISLVISGLKWVYMLHFFPLCRVKQRMMLQTQKYSDYWKSWRKNKQQPKRIVEILTQYPKRRGPSHQRDGQF